MTGNGITTKLSKVF